MIEFKHIKYFVLFSVFVILSCNHKGTEQKRTDEESDYLQLVERKINALTARNQHLKIENQAVYQGNDTLEITDLKQIAESNLFFFYFSSHTCSPCIQQTVNYIKEVWPDYENDDRITFIASDYEPKYRQNCYGKTLVTLSKGQLGIPLEKEQVPFLFTLSDELTIENLHIVNKNDFIKTLDFLKKMNK